MSALIEFQDVCKYYQMGDTTVKAADHISFQVEQGEFLAIVGQSGSGKSTCMNIIGCLDVPTSGTYLLGGQDVGSMNKNELAALQESGEMIADGDAFIREGVVKPASDLSFSSFISEAKTERKKADKATLRQLIADLVSVDAMPDKFKM